MKWTNSLLPALILPMTSSDTMCRMMCEVPHMSTNLSLDPQLLEKALRVSGEKTKKAAVTKALKEFVARYEQKNVAKLFGKLVWDESYDYKKDRSRK